MEKQKVRVVLNRVKELKEIPTKVDIVLYGESPSINTADSYPSKRIQGLIVEITGEKENIDEFLKPFMANGVYRL